MTKKQLLEKLKDIDNSGNHDPEAAHYEADCALLGYIGDKEVAKAYDKIKKWYA